MSNRGYTRVGYLSDVRDELSVSDTVQNMSECDLGRLSDGTELADVIPDMPVEVRDSGGLNWRLGYVVHIEKVPVFPRVWVETLNGSTAPYFPNYVRKYKG